MPFPLNIGTRAILQAVKGLCLYLFEYTDAVELDAVALPHNIPSNRVIQKSGFIFLNTVELEGEQCNHYKLHKRTWETSQA
jgi:ribosomal-protein-alanine N-acetyltransferase